MIDRAVHSEDSDRELTLAWQDEHPPRVHLEANEDGAPLGPKTTLMARTCHLGLDTDGLVCAWGCPSAKRVSHLGNHSQSTTDSARWIPSTVTKCHQGAEGQKGSIIEAEG